MNPSSIHLYTSITANYLPKARVLAESAKRVMPDCVFHLVLCDRYPDGLDWSTEPFDKLLTIDDLPIEQPSAWVFGHSVVELCTAVKGVAMCTIFDRYDAQCVFYFDPDMVIFDRLDELAMHLEDASILLTPHQVEPERSREAIMDNEMASLKYGVFNLGFLGVRGDANGRAFADWWSSRLLEFCRDDRPAGLFTDQKWVNLAPCFFDGIRVLRSPAYNVATWNITTREVLGSFSDGFTVNGEPLGFYHFSGFDSGDQALMLGKYGAGNESLAALRSWYIQQCERHGQSELGALPSMYRSYADGAVVTARERQLYRERVDLQRAFPDPFATEPDGGYRAWYAVNVGVAEAGTQETQRPPAEVFAEFRDWLKQRANLSSSVWRRFALSGLNWMLGLAASVFARAER
jgi:hypothetical protein